MPAPRARARTTPSRIERLLIGKTSKDLRQRSVSVCPRGCGAIAGLSPCTAVAVAVFDPEHLLVRRDLHELKVLRDQRVAVGQHVDFSNLSRRGNAGGHGSTPLR